jgi:hypothetical protein
MRTDLSTLEDSNSKHVLLLSLALLLQPFQQTARHSVRPKDFFPDLVAALHDLEQGPGLGIAEGGVEENVGRRMKRFY